MELYCDFEFYRNDHAGKFDGSEDEFNRLMSAACRKIDYLTGNRIIKAGFLGLTEFQREMVKYAACFQVDYLAEHGVDGGGIVSRYSALDVSVSYDTRSGLKAADRERFSPVGYELLTMSGLISKVC